MGQVPECRNVFIRKCSFFCFCVPTWSVVFNESSFGIV